MTVTGRVVAVSLMVGGVALVGTAPATLASWFVDLVRSGVAAADSATGDDVAEQQLRALRDEVATLRASLPQVPAPE